MPSDNRDEIKALAIKYLNKENRMGAPISISEVEALRGLIFYSDSYHLSTGLNEEQEREIRRIVADNPQYEEKMQYLSDFFHENPNHKAFEQNGELENLLDIYNFYKKRGSIYYLRRIENIDSYAIDLHRKANSYGEDWKNFPLSERLAHNIFYFTYLKIYEIKQVVRSCVFPLRYRTTVLYFLYGCYVISRLVEENKEVRKEIEKDDKFIEKLCFQFTAHFDKSFNMLNENECFKWVSFMIDNPNGETNFSYWLTNYVVTKAMVENWSELEINLPFYENCNPYKELNKLKAKNEKLLNLKQYETLSGLECQAILLCISVITKKIPKDIFHTFFSHCINDFYLELELSTAMQNKTK